MYKVYTKTNCSWCTKAKELLKKHNIEFEEINIDEDPENKLVLKQLILKTLPQIWGNENWEHIGGYRELEEHLNGTK